MKAFIPALIILMLGYYFLPQPIEVRTDKNGNMNLSDLQAECKRQAQGSDKWYFYCLKHFKD